MKPSHLEEEYGDRIVFWRGIDTHYVLPHGCVKEGRNAVKTSISQLGHGRGYVLAAVRNIQRDVPPQNICAMFDAAKEFGEYPLRT